MSVAPLCTGQGAANGARDPWLCPHPAAGGADPSANLRLAYALVCLPSRLCWNARGDLLDMCAGVGLQDKARANNVSKELVENAIKRAVEGKDGAALRVFTSV